MPAAPAPRFPMALLPVVLLLVALSGCAVQAGAVDSGHPTAASVDGRHDLYLSLGDSYAAGYQRLDAQDGATTRNGFAYQVAAKAAAAGQVLQLVNFGCAGQTSTQLVSEQGCQPASLGPGAAGYAGRTQLAAAVALATAHADRVRLITVVIGGNDVQPCLAASDPQGCVEQRIPVLRRNLTTALAALRKAAPKATVVGLTYPNAYLGDWVKGDAGSRRIVTESRTLFHDYLNPALAKTYAAAGARFVDITSATGGYGSMTATTSFAPYGTVPVPVAKACTVTNFCRYGDVHPTTDGYAFIADRILDRAGAAR